MNTIWKLTDINDTQFIHFKRVEVCEAFKQWYSGSIGHTCCNGLGCLLHNVTKLDKVEEIRRSFLLTLSKN